jgi:hypothetical protein
VNENLHGGNVRRDQPVLKGDLRRETAALPQRSKLLVTAVAERPIFAVLAAAEINGAGFLGGVGRGREARAFVAAITERLVFAQAARAPVVSFSGFDGDGQGRFLGNDGKIHGASVGGTDGGAMRF